MQVRFFKQTLCQNALFICTLISFQYIYPLIDDLCAKFFISILLWELNYALDGLIVMLLHFRFSHLGIKLLQKKLPAILLPAENNENNSMDEE
ncbi:hypothetical protein KIN20_025089 [Parelaphostrongylus tenuis]|uniref:7TM GPCR serpentine receptor class x (Srx) domain-containing protein n=1 Tax=Parelaphostrongylus tenuis TaxID=148309 RepID=A0AAD5MXZ1_PARTN|nr:hypothetical protein KIN20_025089 [Parelaphostrongylus tenuis]